MYTLQITFKNFESKYYNRGKLTNRPHLYKSRQSLYRALKRKHLWENSILFWEIKKIYTF